MDVSAGQLKRLSTEELMPSNWTSVVVSQRKTNTTWYRWYMEPRVWHKETYLQNRLFYDLQNRNRLKYIAIVHGVTKCQTWLSHSLSLTLSPLTIQLFHSYWKNHSFDYMDPCQQSMSLLLHILSRFIIAFLPKSKLFLNFMAAVTILCDFGAQENKICHCFHFSPIYLPWSNGTQCHDLSFLKLHFKPTFPFSFAPSSTGSLVPLRFLPVEWYHLHIWDCWYFSQQSWL